MYRPPEAAVSRIARRSEAILHVSTSRKSAYIEKSRSHVKRRAAMNEVPAASMQSRRRVIVPAPMGPNALSSIVDGLHTDTSAVVLSRRNGAWAPEAGRFGEEVRELAAALVAYGLRAGDCGAVLGAEGYDTLRAGLAVLAAGATLVPVDPSVPDGALRSILESTTAVHAIASDERQLARLLALRPELPSLNLLLLMAAAPSERKPAALLVSAALEVGATALVDDPTCLRRAMGESGDHPACVIFGAGAEPRVLSRDSLHDLAETIAGELGVVRGTTVLAALPVAGPERLAVAVAVVARGGTLLIPDPSERPDAGLSSQAADAILLTVAGLERLHRGWLEDIEAGSWIGRRVTLWALGRGKESAPRNWKHRLADLLILRALREKLGGTASTLTVITTPRGGAPSDIDAFFNAAGLTVRYFRPDKGVPLAR
jgi:long-chain acyl-CoA synthetase